MDRAVIEGMTQLCMAAENGHAEVAEALIKAGCDVHKADKGGHTPLFMAAQKGHARVAEALIKAGCDVDKAMHVAAQKRHAEVAKFLIRAGGDVDKAEINGVTPLFMAEKGHAKRSEVEAKQDNC